MNVKSEIFALLKKNVVIVCMFFYFLLIIVVPSSRDVVLKSWYGIIIFTIISLGMIGLMFDIYKVFYKAKELK